MKTKFSTVAAALLAMAGCSAPDIQASVDEGPLTLATELKATTASGEVQCVRDEFRTMTVLKLNDKAWGIVTESDTANNKGYLFLGAGSNNIKYAGIYTPHNKPLVYVDKEPADKSNTDHAIALAIQFADICTQLTSGRNIPGYRIVSDAFETDVRREETREDMREVAELAQITVHPDLIKQGLKTQILKTPDDPK